MRLKLFVVLLLLACVLGVNVGNKENVRNEIVLSPPPFIAEAAETGAKAFPEDEAGISAYVNIGKSIDLSKVKDKLKSIEAYGEDYIIGVLDLSSPEPLDPHVYIHRDGWIMAYYTKNDPASKVIDLAKYEDNIPKTTLEEAIEEICSYLFIPYSSVEDEIGWYDFRYPDAKHLMVIVEVTIDWAAYAEDYFTLEIPDGLLLYEASWCHWIKAVYRWDGDWAKMYFDEIEINNMKFENGCWYNFGYFDLYDLSQGTHTITIKHGYLDSDKSGVVVALIY